MNMKSSLSLVMLASLSLFGCGKDSKGTKDKKKNDVVAMAETTEIPMFRLDDTELVYGDTEDSTDTEEFAYNDNDLTYNEDEDLVAWQDDAFLEESAEVEFKTVLFEFNGKAPSQDQVNLLNEDITMAFDAINDGKRLKIHAHCCQMGAAAYNLGLSEKRAQSVKDVFVKNGIPEEKIDIIGFGQEVPLVWTESAEREGKIKDLSLNRRAEIFAYSEETEEDDA